MTVLRKDHDWWLSTAYRSEAFANVSLALGHPDLLDYDQISENQERKNASVDSASVIVPSLESAN